MVFDPDPEERRLARRLFHSSRFHPLLMDRLARLAAAPALRPRLLAALAALEESNGFDRLPGLFAMQPGAAADLAYLDDVLNRFIGQLIEDSSPDARQLLWVIALANQPGSVGLVRGVWRASGGRRQTQIRAVEETSVTPAVTQLRPKASPSHLRIVRAQCPTVAGLD